MKQKVLKRLGLLALSTVMVVPNVLVETKAEAFPKLSTEDAGKNPKKESTVKAKSGSGFFGKLFKTVGVLFALNETHNLIRNLIGNPWFCLGMARGLFKQTTEESLNGKVLFGYERSEKLLQYFQRKTGEQHVQYEEENQPTTPTKPVFRGVITPLTDAEIDAEIDRGLEFAKNHPNLALLILKRFDAMLALGIDKLQEFVDSSTSSYNMIA
ncbi:MAG: hypothetical protein J6K87_02940 [Clostridia bacterium]|nr:hypothetical protein [Clostridia bacterium]